MFVHSAPGERPALTSSAFIPDLHHFRGSYGAKDTIPLYRSGDATEPNSFRACSTCSATHISSRDTRGLPGLRLRCARAAGFHRPLPQGTGDTRTARAGHEGRGPVRQGPQRGCATALAPHLRRALRSQRQATRPRPNGEARCVKAVPGDRAGYPESFEYNDATRILNVGGGRFAPVSREVFEFEVSGLKVVQSWLRYRMKKGAGKKSSPLDEIRPERWPSQFTTELLELLWCWKRLSRVPRTDEAPRSGRVGQCFNAGEMPPVRDEARKPPAHRRVLNGELFDDL